MTILELTFSISNLLLNGIRTILTFKKKDNNSLIRKKSNIEYLNNLYIRDETFRYLNDLLESETKALYEVRNKRLEEKRYYTDKIISIKNETMEIYNEIDRLKREKTKLNEEIVRLRGILDIRA